MTVRTEQDGLYVTVFISLGEMRDMFTPIVQKALGADNGVLTSYTNLPTVSSIRAMTQAAPKGTRMSCPAAAAYRFNFGSVLVSMPILPTPVTHRSIPCQQTITKSPALIWRGHELHDD